MMKISTAVTFGLLTAGVLGVAASPAAAFPMAQLSSVSPSSDLDRVQYRYHHHHGFHHHHGYHHGYGFHHRHGFYHHHHHGIPGHPIRRLLHRL